MNQLNMKWTRWMPRLMVLLLIIGLTGCGRMARSTDTEGSVVPSPGVATVSFQQSQYQVGLSEQLSLFSQLSSGALAPESLDFYCSDTSVATVGSDGKVKPQVPGVVTIQAVLRSNRSVSASVTVIVSNVPSVALSNVTLGLYEGGTHTLSVMGTVNDAIRWASSAPSVATVQSSTGVVTALKKGTAVVSAYLKTTGEWVGECQVTVQSPIIDITITQSNMTVEAGRTLMIPATVQTVGGVIDSIVWESSNPLVVSQAPGVNTFLARTAGTVTLTARSNTDPTKTKSVTVVVTQATGGELVVYPSNTQVLVGTQLGLDVTAPLGRVLTYQSNNRAVATVSEGGVVTAMAPGTAVVTVQTNGVPVLTATSTIQVVAASVTEVIPAQTAVAMNIGQALSLSATVYPSQANQAVMWSLASGAGVVTVSGGGGVAALSPGRAVLKVASVSQPSVFALVEVVVNAPLVTSLTLTPATLQLAMGESQLLNATVLPAQADQRLKWESSDFVVAEVDGVGRVSGKITGTSTITVRSVLNPAVSQTCVVTVRPVTVQSVTIQSSLALQNSNAISPVAVGYEETLTATVLTSPASTQKTIWTTSNPAVARISPSGRLVMVGPGVAVITAYSPANPTVVSTLTVKAAANSVQSEGYRIVDRSNWVPDATRSNKAYFFTSEERTYLRGLNQSQPYAWENDMVVDFGNTARYVYVVLYMIETQSNQYAILEGVRGVLDGANTVLQVTARRVIDPHFPSTSPVILIPKGVRMVIEIDRGNAGSGLNFRMIDLNTPTQFLWL